MISSGRPSFSKPGSPYVKRRFSQAPPPPSDPVEAAKRLAAYAAVDRHVKPGMRIVGIGSGSTVPYVVERIVQQGDEENRERCAQTFST